MQVLMSEVANIVFGVISGLLDIVALISILCYYKNQKKNKEK